MHEPVKPSVKPGMAPGATLCSLACASLAAAEDSPTMLTETTVVPAGVPAVSPSSWTLAGGTPAAVATELTTIVSWPAEAAHAAVALGLLSVTLRGNPKVLPAEVEAGVGAGVGAAVGASVMAGAIVVAVRVHSLRSLVQTYSAGRESSTVARTRHVNDD